MEGNIVVDGVLASCYGTVDHDLAHILLTPLRWFPGMMNWIIGMNRDFSLYTDLLVDLGQMIQLDI